MTAADPIQLLLDKQFTVADLARLRSLIADSATLAGLSGQRGAEFVLVANELIANAIEHGGGHGLLRVFRAGGALHCQVRDHGPGFSPDDRDRDGDGYGDGDGARDVGGGLVIVRELADRLDFGANGTGAIVTAAMAIDAAG